jgi:histidinol-phosphate phosphatase family protein
MFLKTSENNSIVDGRLRTAVILAGGKGTRLRSVTRDLIPKVMAPVCDRPLLEYQIETLRRAGIDHIHLIVGHLADHIEHHFENGDRFGVKIVYHRESEPMGTAGMLPTLGFTEPYLLVCGDVFFDIDIARLTRFHFEKPALATLCVHPNDHMADSDTIFADASERITGISPKHSQGIRPNAALAGISVVDPLLLEGITAGEPLDFERDIIANKIESGRLFAYKTPEFIMDAGTEERLAAVEATVRSGKPGRRNLNEPQKAVFLDRDGVLNKIRQKGVHVTRGQDLALEAGAVDALAMLNRSDYLTIVVTNQPCIAQGLCTEEEMREIHEAFAYLLGLQGVYVNAIYWCPHAWTDGCDCRKPRTGMLTMAAEQYHLDFAQCFMVGDMTSDIQAGCNAGMRTILVKTGEAGEDGRYAARPDFICANLEEAVREVILNDENRP